MNTMARYFVLLYNKYTGTETARSGSLGRAYNFILTLIAQEYFQRL